MGVVCLTTAWIIRVASVGATAQDWRPITDRPTDTELGSDESGHRSAIGTADVDIEPVVQVVHSVGSIRFGRLPRREPTTVLVALRDAVVRSVPELGSGCRYRPGRGQVERHPHALRDPRGIGDRFCAGAEDRIPATSSSGPPGHGGIDSRVTNSQYVGVAPLAFESLRPEAERGSRGRILGIHDL